MQKQDLINEEQLEEFILKDQVGTQFIIRTNE